MTHKKGTKNMYKKLYCYLFNCVTDALCLLSNGQPEAAAGLLIRAQRECEKRVLES